MQDNCTRCGESRALMYVGLLCDNCHARKLALDTMLDVMRSCGLGEWQVNEEKVTTDAPPV